MTYCSNPQCQKPQNIDSDRLCQCCGYLLCLSDRYRLVKLLGQGGFGRTFLSIDSNHSFWVIKQLFPRHSEPQSTILFQQEIQFLKALGNHPQIPGMLESFEQEHYQYLVQEFIDGQNLEQELQATGVFDETKIRQLLQDVLPILKFVHDHRVIHRDIKPENLIRQASSDRLFLVDFGAAKQVNSSSALQRETSIGSPEYVAPEQAKGKATFASDLYSLGVTCIHLLTHLSPFDLVDVTSDRWVWQQFLPQPVSFTLAQVLDKLLQSAVSSRFQSVDEVLTAMNLPPVKPPPLQQWQCIQTIAGIPGVGSSSNAIALSPGGEMLASGGDDKLVRLWNLQGQLLTSLTGHTGAVNAVVFHPNGKHLFSGSDDGTIKLWDLQQQTILHSFTGHTQGVKAIALSADGQSLASGGADRTIRLWNVSNFALLHTLSAHALQLTAIAFSSDGAFLASASLDRTAKVWRICSDLADHPPQLCHIFPRHTRAVMAIALSPNGQQLATGSDDNTIHIFDLQTGQHLRALTNHSWSVVALAFADSQTLISGSWDKTIKLWNTSTGAELANLTGHIDSVKAIAFHPTEPLIFSSGKDKTIKIWRRVEAFQANPY